MLHPECKAVCRIVSSPNGVPVSVRKLSCKAVGVSRPLVIAAKLGGVFLTTEKASLYEPVGARTDTFKLSPYLPPRGTCIAPV